MPSANDVAAATKSVMTTGQRVGAIVLLCLAILALSGVLVWERLHGERQVFAVVDRWTGTDHKTYALDVDRRFKEQETQIQALKEGTAAIRATLEGMRQEQGRQGAQIDRLVERTVGPR